MLQDMDAPGDTDDEGNVETSEVMRAMIVFYK